MNTLGFLRRLRTLLDTPAAAILLSVLYPTVFALSKNWYAFSAQASAWLVAFAALLTLVGYFAFVLLRAISVPLLGVAGAGAQRKWSEFGPDILLATACLGAMFFLLGGTLLSILGGPWQVICLLVLSVAGATWLFRRGMLAYFTSTLGLLAFIAAGEFAYSYLSNKAPATPGSQAVRKADFETWTFLEKPNIYFFIYDAYGSQDVYEKNFGFDNSLHYKRLEERGFEVGHTLSNYVWTWPTTLSVFLGSHHFYDMISGNADTKLGRGMMAGLDHNPVLETLKRNGYKLQYIHETNHFVKDRGIVEFRHPADPIYVALKIYGSPALNRMVFKRSDSIEVQKAALFDRLDGVMSGSANPWFTFFWVPLPSHANKNKDWLQLADFEERFRERTVLANAHMLEVMGRIIEKDPTAMIAIIGDHGAWRYNRIWTTHEEPIEAFNAAKVGVETVTRDLFGIMVAVRHAHRCDRILYPGLTPVNLMRVMFACLSNKTDRLFNKADDVSIFPGRRGKLWLTARNGQLLPTWEPYAPPN